MTGVHIEGHVQIAAALQGSDLIDILDARYPALSPREKDTERRIWMDAGRRELIEELIYLRDSGQRSPGNW